MCVPSTLMFERKTGSTGSTCTRPRQPCPSTNPWRLFGRDFWLDLKFLFLRESSQDQIILFCWLVSRFDFLKPTKHNLVDIYITRKSYITTLNENSMKFSETYCFDVTFSDDGGRRRGRCQNHATVFPRHQAVRLPSRVLQRPEFRDGKRSFKIDIFPEMSFFTIFLHNL